MKILARAISNSAALASIAALALSPLGAAEEGKKKDDHDHHHHMAGPNGGKVLHQIDPHAELLVTKERKLRVTFLTEEGKATALKEQTISVICGKRTKPVRMKFAKEGSSLISDKPLPAGTHIPTVLQIKMAPKEKPSIIRLNLNLEDCPTCDYLEYACTCDHGHEHEHEDKKK